MVVCAILITKDYYVGNILESLRFVNLFFVKVIGLHAHGSLTLEIGLCWLGSSESFSSNVTTYQAGDRVEKGTTVILSLTLGFGHQDTFTMSSPRSPKAW